MRLKYQSNADEYAIALILMTILSANSALATANKADGVQSFTLRVTSQAVNQTIPFIGSYMTIGKNNAQYYQLNQKTPFETQAIAKVINAMFKVNNNGPAIKVVLLKNNQPVASGTGHAIILFAGSSAQRVPQLVIAN